MDADWQDAAAPKTGPKPDHSSATAPRPGTGSGNQRQERHNRIGLFVIIRALLSINYRTPEEVSGEK